MANIIQGPGPGVDIRPLNNLFTGSDEFAGTAPAIISDNRIDIGTNSGVDGELRLISQATGFYNRFVVPTGGASANRTLTLPDASGVPLLVGNGADPATSGNIAKVNRLGQTGNITTGTKLTNAVAAGAFTVTVYMSCSAAGSAGNSVTVTLVWTDDVGIKNKVITLQSDNTANRADQLLNLYLGSGDITWGAVRTGGTYNLRIRAIRTE